MKDEEFSEVMWTLISVLGVVMIAPMIFASALMTQLAWGWFVVPLGVPPLMFFQAMGFRALISGLRLARPKTGKDDQTIKDCAMSIWGSHLCSVTSFFFLWLVHFGV